MLSVVPVGLWLDGFLEPGAGACSPPQRTTYLYGAAPGSFRLDPSMPVPIPRRIDLLEAVDESGGGCWHVCPTVHDEQEKLVLDAFEGDALYICGKYQESPNECLSSRWGVVPADDGTFYAIMKGTVPRTTEEYVDGAFRDISQAWLFAATYDGRHSSGVLITVDDLRDASNRYCDVTCTD